MSSSSLCSEEATISKHVGSSTTKNHNFRDNDKMKKKEPKLLKCTRHKINGEQPHKFRILEETEQHKITIPLKGLNDGFSDFSIFDVFKPIYLKDGSLEFGCGYCQMFLFNNGSHLGVKVLI